MEKEISDGLLTCPFCNTSVDVRETTACSSCAATIRLRGGIEDRVHKQGLVLLIVAILFVGLQIAGGNLLRALILAGLFCLAAGEQYWRWHYKKAAVTDIRFSRDLDSRPPTVPTN